MFFRLIYDLVFIILIPGSFRNSLWLTKVKLKTIREYRPEVKYKIKNPDRKLIHFTTNE